MNKKTIGLLLLGAAAVWYMTSQKKEPNGTSNDGTPPPPPPPPPPGAPISQIQRWVVALMSLYGSAEWLWQPGGPLYGRSRNQDLQIINSNPDSDTSGYA